MINIKNLNLVLQKGGTQKQRHQYLRCFTAMCTVLLAGNFLTCPTCSLAVLQFFLNIYYHSLNKKEKCQQMISKMQNAPTNCFYKQHITVLC